MENLIQKYLKQNNVEGKNGVDYRLEDSGNGIEIKGWKLSIEKPTFTQEEIDADVLEQEKNLKILELKSKRDEKLTKSIFTVSVDGVDCAFYLRTADLPTIKEKIADLSNNTDTKTWGDINGKRINLNKVFFERLKNHIKTNDETIWDLYGEKLAELEDLAKEESTTLEDIKNFNTNLI